MGIDIRAAIFVGLPRGQIEKQELIEEEELEVCPYYYDGNSDDGAIAGLQYQYADGPTEVEWDPAKVDELRAAFLALTGQEPKVWVSPYVF